MDEKKIADKKSGSYLKENLGIGFSINDLREKEFNGEKLSYEEWQALKNFDKFRIAELNNQKSDMEFHKRYREIQVMANLGDYKEFLKEKYSKL